MKANYTLNIDDLMSFQEYYISESKTFFRLKLFNSIIWPIFITIPIFVYGFIKGINQSLIIINIISNIFIFLGIFIPFKKNYLKGIKKTFNEGNTKNIIGNTSMEITNELLIIKINGNEEKIRYDSFLKIQENEYYIYLYVSENSAHILPKSKILNVDHGTAEGFLKYIRTHIK